MAALPAEVYDALNQLLPALQSADNPTRSQAEEQLNNEWFVKQPEYLLTGLAEQSKSSQSIQTRSFAAVLCRRMATRQTKVPPNGDSKELYMSLSDPAQQHIRGMLLQALSEEQDSHVRNKLGDAVAEIARQHVDEGGAWPELLAVIFQLSQSPEPTRREAAFRVFATTPGIIGKSHEAAVAGAFEKAFKDENTSVRISALEAFAAFFRNVPKKSQKKYTPLIPELLNILPGIKEAQNSDDLSKALSALMDLAGYAPKMFQPMFNNLVRFCIAVVQDKELDDIPRQNALELMATFADCAPNMCKKDPLYAQDMVMQCLSLMTDVGLDDEEASEWNAEDNFEQDENDENHVVGEQTLDRLANKLTGDTILMPAFNWLPRMLTSSAWRDRHAALMAISAISEGCHDKMVGELNKVLELVCPTLNDPHSRVRWAGCNALGQMSTDFAGTMQESFHDVVLRTLIPVLDDSEPRVKAHAAAALVNFCEQAEPEILVPYLDDLLNQLLKLLQNPKRYVQEQALSTVATVADSAEAAFSRYYDSLMPQLFHVLRQPQESEFRLLRAKAMECATLIALAVGREKLGNDAGELVQILSSIQAAEKEPDDPQVQYLLHSWGRMCQVLGKEFVPCLGIVMPPLLEMATAKADIQLLDDEDQVAQIDQDDGWELVPLRGKVIGIRTATLDDKNTSIQLLVVYAGQLEDAFAPYAAEIMEKIALPGLAFFFHDPVRVTSAKLVPQLLNCIKKSYGANSRELRAIWESSVDKLIEVLSAEPAIDTLADMYQCFYESVEIMGKSCLSPADMTTFIQATMSTIEDYQTRDRARAEERDAEDGEEDPEEVLEAIEDDQTLLSDMNKAFHMVFKNHGSEFLPAWQKLLPLMDSFAQASDPSQRQWALCITDDILEFCGETSWQFHEHFVPPLIGGLRDDTAANRQAAAYGLGVCALHGGPAWADTLAASIPDLFAVAHRPDARLDDHVFATENACASVAKILSNNAAKVQNPAEVARAWIELLPVTNDEEAAPYAYMFLVGLIEQRNPMVTSQPSRMLAAVAPALAAEALQGQTASRVIGAIRSLMGSTGTDVRAALAALPVEVQQAVVPMFAS